LYNVQLNSCIPFGVKVEINPKGFALGRNIVTKKKFQFVATYYSMLQFMAIDYPQGKKKSYQ
jgi:hypothetical protein